MSRSSAHGLSSRTCAIFWRGVASVPALERERDTRPARTCVLTLTTETPYSCVSQLYFCHVNGDFELDGVGGRVNHGLHQPDDDVGKELLYAGTSYFSSVLPSVLPSVPLYSGGVLRSGSPSRVGGVLSRLPP